jgi:predicted nucleic acid-binding protein
MLLDSNILIYAAQPDHAYLIDWIKQNLPAVSVISMVEVLGYHQLTIDDKHCLETLFANLILLYPTPMTIRHAIQLRQQRKMSLGDVLIAATAIEHRMALVTRNILDFQWIDELQIINPVKA